MGISSPQIPPLQCVASADLAGAVKAAAAFENITISGFIRRALAYYAQAADLPVELAARIHVAAVAQKSGFARLIDSTPRLKGDLEAGAEA